MLQYVAAWFSVSIIFSNMLTCLHGNTISRRYNIEPMLLEEYLNVLPDT